MASSTPPALLSLSATSKVAANARPPWERRNLFARRSTAAASMKTLPPPSAERFVPVSMLQPLHPVASAFLLGDGLPLPPPFWLLPLFPGLLGRASRTRLILRLSPPPR